MQALEEVCKMEAMAMRLNLTNLTASLGGDFQALFSCMGDA